MGETITRRKLLTGIGAYGAYLYVDGNEDVEFGGGGGGIIVEESPSFGGVDFGEKSFGEAQ